MTRKEKERQDAIDQLRNIIAPGSTVFTILKHVSRSGMMRHISCVRINGDTISGINYLVAQAIGATLAKDGSIKIGGCGTDMGFEIVYNLGRVLFPNGGDLRFSPRKAQEERAGKLHESDGGYLLNQRWI